MDAAKIGTLDADQGLTEGRRRAGSVDRRRQGLKLCGAAAILVCLVVVIALAQQRSGSVTAAGPQSPPVAAVSVPGTVIGDMRDSLKPLPDGTSPAMPIEAVLKLLQANPSTAGYTADLSSVTVEAGVYTNPNLRDANGSSISDRVVYTVTGRTTCVARSGVPNLEQPTTTPKSVVCVGVIIVDGATGQPLALDETQEVPAK
jgi:hypothetical protein